MCRISSFLLGMTTISALCYEEVRNYIIMENDAMDVTFTTMISIGLWEYPSMRINGGSAYIIRGLRQINYNQHRGRINK